jgi:hypothetical protein
VVLFKIGEMRGEGSLPQFTRGCGRAEDRGRRSRQYQAWGHLPVRKKMHVKEGFYGLPRVMPSLWKRMKTASFTKIKGMDLP